MVLTVVSVTEQALIYIGHSYIRQNLTKDTYLGKHIHRTKASRKTGHLTTFLCSITDGPWFLCSHCHHRPLQACTRHHLWPRLDCIYSSSLFHGVCRWIGYQGQTQYRHSTYHGDLTRNAWCNRHSNNSFAKTPIATWISPVSYRKSSNSWRISIVHQSRTSRMNMRTCGTSLLALNKMLWKWCTRLGEHPSKGTRWQHEWNLNLCLVACK